jgi:cysteine desulfurase
VLWRGIKKAYPRAEVNGVQVSSIKYQVSSAAPHVLNVYFPGVRAEELLVKLDRAGVAASAGPACSSRSLEPSRVVQALGHSAQRARESVRFSMGRYTTAAEIGRAVRGIAHVI